MVGPKMTFYMLLGLQVLLGPYPKFIIPMGKMRINGKRSTYTMLVLDGLKWHLEDHSHNIKLVNK
ncbi:MAG: hypothetical protein B6D41_10155 [Chloroflexi bacterium UTCFX4]|nr:MAG: hypothetical protein B6D41_10155 [Chloroflexi bacterium UTCFX4]